METIKNTKESGLKNYFYKIFHSVMIVANISIVFWVLWYCQYGIDVTDEGFYLNWIKNPYNFKTAFSLFGFFYHFFYNVFNSNIVFLRQFNVLLTFSLSWFLGFFILRKYLNKLLDYKLTLLYSSSLAISSLLFYSLWLPTPNYNFLNFQSLLIVSLGIIVFGNEQNSFKFFTGCLLIGLGGVICFIAKSSSAMLLLIITVIYLGFFYKQIKHIAWSALAALVVLLLFMLIIRESPHDIYLKMSEGIRLTQLLAGGHTYKNLFRVDTFQLSYLNYIFLFLLTGFSYVVFQLLERGKALLGFFVLLMSMTLIIFVVILLSGLINLKQYINLLDTKLIVSVVFSFLVNVYFIKKESSGKNSFHRNWWLITFFICLPFVYCFGTNNNYWEAATNVSFFWILSTVIFISPLINQYNIKPLFISSSLVIIFIVGGFIYSGISTPYRQPKSLYEYRFSADIEKNSSLLVTKEVAEYFMALKEFALKEAISSDTPMIDLTGHSPGVLSALGVNVLGQPWILGGYPGSELVAKDILKNLSCELSTRAWILTEVGGNLSISSKVLDNIGLKLEKDYHLIYSITVPSGLAGNKEESRTQFFYKPKLEGPEALKACVKAKQLALLR